MPMALETICFRVNTIITSSAAAASAAAAAAAASAAAAAAATTTTSTRNWACFPSINKGMSSLLRHRMKAATAVSSVSPFGAKMDRRRNRLICRAKNTVDEVLVVVEANWQSLVMESKMPVMVEFWAPWCGPCRMIAPVIKELAKDYTGKIVCCQVNTDDCPRIAARFGIRSVPTVLMFKDGEKKESIIGAVPKTTLVATVDKYLEL